MTHAFRRYEFIWDVINMDVGLAAARRGAAPPADYRTVDMCKNAWVIYLSTTLREKSLAMAPFYIHIHLSM